MEFRKFRGTDKYLTSSALESAVNCALALERPLLVRGEPGTGNTQLAEVIARERPVVVITSNAEKELPDAFLRRCVFHFIEFPEKDLMARIVRVHHPDLDQKLLDQTLRAFYSLRDVDGLRKRPSTSELIDWIAVLRRAGIASVELDAGMPFLGALLKREQDLIAFAEAASRGRRPRA